MYLFGLLCHELLQCFLVLLLERYENGSGLPILLFDVTCLFGRFCLPFIA